MYSSISILITVVALIDMKVGGIGFCLVPCGADDESQIDAFICSFRIFGVDDKRVMSDVVWLFLRQVVIFHNIYASLRVLSFPFFDSIVVIGVEVDCVRFNPTHY